MTFGHNKGHHNKGRPLEGSGQVGTHRLWF